jgi:hypothetical protein
MTLADFNLDPKSAEFCWDIQLLRLKIASRRPADIG